VFLSVMLRNVYARGFRVVKRDLKSLFGTRWMETALHRVRMAASLPGAGTVRGVESMDVVYRR